MRKGRRPSRRGGGIAVRDGRDGRGSSSPAAGRSGRRPCSARSGRGPGCARGRRRPRCSSTGRPSRKGRSRCSGPGRAPGGTPTRRARRPSAWRQARLRTTLGLRAGRGFRRRAAAGLRVRVRADGDGRGVRIAQLAAQRDLGAVPGEEPDRGPDGAADARAARRDDVDVGARRGPRTGQELADRRRRVEAVDREDDSESPFRGEILGPDGAERDRAVAGSLRDPPRRGEAVPRSREVDDHGAESTTTAPRNGSPSPLHVHTGRFGCAVARRRESPFARLVALRGVADADARG